MEDILNERRKYSKLITTLQRDVVILRMYARCLKNLVKKVDL